MAQELARVTANPKRVVVLGPESTGKSTLAAALAGHYGESWAPEYLRRFVDRKKVRPGTRQVDKRDTRAIVAGQLAAEDRAVRRAKQVVFFDTNPLQTIVYYEHYFGDPRPLWLESVLLRRPYDFYLLLDVDVPWVGDPRRDRPRFRRGSYRLFRAALVSRRLPFVRIFGTWAERRKRAIRAVDRLLAR